MLTLMSKPVRKWEVLLGKYLGIILAALLAVAILGLVLSAMTWFRIPRDYIIRGDSLDERERQRLFDIRLMHLAGLWPALLLEWLKISVLASVGVALSTRVPLVVNLPVVILVYIAGNLVRFLYPLEGQSWPAKSLAVFVSTVLPSLDNLDLTRPTIFQRIAVGQFITDPAAISLATIWGYVALATVYAAVYILFALTAGLWLFHNRELGGAEG